MVHVCSFMCANDLDMLAHSQTFMCANDLDMIAPPQTFMCANDLDMIAHSLNFYVCQWFRHDSTQPRLLCVPMI